MYSPCSCCLLQLHLEPLRMRNLLVSMTVYFRVYIVQYSAAAVTTTIRRKWNDGHEKDGDYPLEWERKGKNNTRLVWIWICAHALWEACTNSFRFGSVRFGLSRFVLIRSIRFISKFDICCARRGSIFGYSSPFTLWCSTRQLAPFFTTTLNPSARVYFI